MKFELARRNLLSSFPEHSTIMSTVSVPSLKPSIEKIFSLISANELLEKAIEKDDEIMVQYLLQHPDCDPTNDSINWLKIAATGNHVAILKLLLEDRRANPTEKESACLITITDGCFEVIDLILKDGRADPTSRNSLCLRTASRNGHTKVVDLLLKDGRADPTVDNNYCLRWAGQNKHYGVVALLLKDGRIDPTAQNNHYFEWAVSNDRDTLVRLFLEDGRIDLSSDSEHLSNGNTEIDRMIREYISKKVVSGDIGQEESDEEQVPEKPISEVSISIKAIRRATRKNLPKVVSFLWSNRKSDLEPIREELVNWAVEQEHLELIDQLLV